jgi:hypothetical protein
MATFSSNTTRGYTQPMNDPEAQRDLERRAQQQAEAIDAEFEVIGNGENQPKLPVKVSA